MPHSISGMYAMYWIKKYPYEVDSMIALDVRSPQSYVEEYYKVTMLDKIEYIGVKLGLHRQKWLLNFIGIDLSISNYGIYDYETFKAIEYLNIKNPYSMFMMSESKYHSKNAKISLDNINQEYKDKKKLFIQSYVFDDTIGDFYNKYGKNEFLKYINESKIDELIIKLKKIAEEEKQNWLIDENSYFVKVDGPHCLYYYPTEKLVDYINEFLSENL